MKHRKQLPFLFLILAAAMFGSRELVHPFFHPGTESRSGAALYHCGTPGAFHLSDTAAVGHTDGDRPHIHSKPVCPICSSAAVKSILPPAAESGTFTHLLPVGPQFSVIFHVISRGKPVSRGPPILSPDHNFFLRNGKSRGILPYFRNLSQN
ncbi:MAG: hypothetical protein PHH77_10710 [Victivallaceae bacterium]|nr:hypothetical protein [Victivallaceae bacterium]